MTKSKKAVPAGPRPRHGGSFVRDAKTGQLQCIQRTEAAGIRAKRAEVAAPDEAGQRPGQDPAGTASGGSTSTDQQEG